MEWNRRLKARALVRFLFAAAILGLFPAAVLPQAANQKDDPSRNIQPLPHLPVTSASTGTVAAGPPATGLSEPGLPPVPQGASTVIGGEIREVDPVLDTLTLKVPGGHEQKIFFDARTKLYRDGVQTSLEQLHAGQHASVETTLDGSDVFAVSIRMLTHAPTGECQGQVLSYDPGNGNLSIRSTLSTMPIKLRVPPGTSITRGGQAAQAPGSAGSSDLVPGALVEAIFASGHSGRGIARSITVLAQPGTAFEFRGTVSYLNLSTGKLTLLDPRNHKTYPISFDLSTVPAARGLHEGEAVTVTAGFDGRTYTARKITPH